MGLVPTVGQLKRGFKMRYQIHQAPKMAIMFQDVTSQILDYKHVATIEAESLEHCFHRGNFENWREHEDTVMIDQARSLSVGDLLIDENGHAYVCCGVGFKTLHCVIRYVQLANDNNTGLKML